MTAHETPLDSASREEVELIAAGVLRAIARDSYKRHRNARTATREASQLVHLALRLERFANDSVRPPRQTPECAG